MSDPASNRQPAGKSGKLAIRIIILAIILGSAVVGRVTWMTLHRDGLIAPQQP